MGDYAKVCYAPIAALLSIFHVAARTFIPYSGQHFRQPEIPASRAERALGDLNSFMSH